MAKGIYCYIDKKDNQIVYVGKDSNIDKKKRHRDHLAPSKYNQQPINRILQSNPDRYKYQALWKIDDCTDSHLNQMEIYYIGKYDPKFNFTEGGDGSSGFKHSEESRKKMSENNSRYWRGKTLSKETRKKISESMKGKKPHEMTEETRRRMSETRNTTGFYRVNKSKKSNYKQGFTWRYEYSYKSIRKAITSVDLKKLEEKVRKEGLEWKVINKENSIKSIRENEGCT